MFNKKIWIQVFALKEEFRCLCQAEALSYKSQSSRGVQLRTMCNCLALGSVQHSPHRCCQTTLLCSILRLKTHIASHGWNGEMTISGKATPQVMHNTISRAFQRCCATFNGGALVILGWMHQSKDMPRKGCGPKPCCRSPRLTATGQQVTTVWMVGTRRHLHMSVRKVHKVGIRTRTFDLSTRNASSLCFLLPGFTSCLLNMQH